jgi:hypothetical protein
MGAVMFAPAAQAVIDNQPGPVTPPGNTNTVAVAPTVSGDQGVHESEFGTPAPNTTACTTVAARGLPGVTNFSIYTGAGTSGAAPDSLARMNLQTQAIAAPTTFNWSNFRWPAQTYHYRTSTQNRNQTGTCAVSGTVNVKTDPYYVNLANQAKIVDITGNGASGVSAEVSAKLVDGAHGDQVVKIGTGTLALQATRNYTVVILGFTVPFTVGSIGRNTSSIRPDGTATSGTAGTFPSIYTALPVSTAGMGPADQADNTSIPYFNRFTITTDTGPKTVECTNVFRNTVGSSTGTDTFNGFAGCTAFGAAGVMQASSVIADAHVPATLTFTIDGHSATGVVDPTTGIATAVVDTPNVPIAPAVPVTVTSSNDGFLAPGTGTNTIAFKGGTITTIDATSPHEAFWNEDFPVKATVLGDPIDDPATSGTVTFKLGSASTAPIPVDSNGVAVGVLHATDAPPAPGAPAQHLVAEYSGTALYNLSDDSDVFTTKPRPTTLVYTGDTSGRFSSTITYSAKLTDTRYAAALQPSALAGKTIAFKNGDSPAVTAVTGADGVASIDVPVTSDVGTYQLTTNYFALDSTKYVPSSDSDAFTVDYQYRFTDTLVGNDGTVLLNPDTQQAGVEAPNGDRSRIADNAYQLSLWLPTVIGYPTAPTVTLPELPEEWNILNLPYLGQLFGLVASPPTVTPPSTPTTPPTVPPTPALPVLPELPIALPMSSSSSVHSNAGGPEMKAGSIVLPDLIEGSPGSGPNGGMTFGDLVNSVAGAGIPTSLSTCELLSGSTCERRFIIAAVLGEGPNVVGVFDVHNGLFASVVRAPTIGFAPLPLLASLGSCVNPVPLCIGAPAPPSGVPTLPPPPAAPDTGGLLGAIQALIAGLQSLPGQVTAPPAPTVPETPEVPMGSSTATPAPTGTLLSGAGNTLATLVPAYWLG